MIINIDDLLDQQDELVKMASDPDPTFAQNNKLRIETVIEDIKQEKKLLLMHNEHFIKKLAMYNTHCSAEIPEIYNECLNYYIQFLKNLKLNCKIISEDDRLEGCL